MGAIAGFAVAIIFTWRMLRSPSGSQRRVQKRQSPASSSSGINAETATTVVPSGACSTSDDLTAQNVVDEFFQPEMVIDGDVITHDVPSAYN